MISCRVLVLLLSFSIISTIGICESLEQSIIERKKMGEQPNLLVNEKSPYLLQHAFNPVRWYPWGEEAFTKAKAEDKPIFLSIGYSTCHWCHVMAEESFANEEIAAILNKWFVSIKVDREERPDIDQMYMAVTQAMTGSGGWPMSVFLFPDGKPFYAATYIPPVNKYGRPGMPDLLAAINSSWLNKRQDLRATAGQLLHSLQATAGEIPHSLRKNILEIANEDLMKAHDDRWGGFSEAPKFPSPVITNFLFRQYRRTGDEKALAMALWTLRKMAEGGIYDQLGGGFHRYSVDGQWRVPHFEKMLYDQAQLVNTYLDAFLLSEDKFFANVAEDTLEYTLRDLLDSEGAFYSAEDADSEDPYQLGKHGEGSFFLWTEEDIVQTLGKKKANIFNYIHGVEFDGNALADPHQEFINRNILYLKHSAEDAARHFNIPVEDILINLVEAKELLFKKREQRKRPHLDDKVITSWNGMMIGALARGGVILQRADFVGAAERATSFIKLRLYDDEKKQLLRRYRQGESGLVGQLDDYTNLVAGLLELYQVVQQPEILQWAITLTEQQIAFFWDNEGGGFFDSVHDATIPLRLKADYDGAEPAPNSSAVINLLTLADITGNAEWRKKAAQTMKIFARRINQYPKAMLHLLGGLERSQQKPRQVVIAGDSENDITKKMMELTHMQYDPGRLLLLAEGGANQKLLGKTMSFIASLPQESEQPTAYICEDYACMLPILEIEEFTRALTATKEGA